MNKNEKPSDGMITFAVASGLLPWLVMGLAGLAVFGFIIYGIVRMFFRYVFDTELPNP